MRNGALTVVISIAGAWILILVTKLLSGDFIERTKLFERGSFDIKLETVLVGVYMLVMYLILSRLNFRKRN
jgi:hypothetical protein